jgi:predicted dehydrogenase
MERNEMKTIRVGIVGCGGFVRGMHVPNLREHPSYEIRATCDLNEEAAKSLGADCKAAYFTTDLNKILKDPEIDLVVIGTRHDQHCELSVRAAEAGKHILCEKPMGLSLEECRRVIAAVRKSKVKYTVGYNRGLSPYILKAKDLLRDRTDKLMIYYRIQAPFPVSHWIHDPKIGGGRFVGEGCHIFDLLCELVACPPVSIYAAGGIFLDPAKVKIPDTALITIAFEDGSAATTLIHSNGCQRFPKEAAEIYVAGKAIYLEDYSFMDCYGFDFNGKTTFRTEKTDKGHKNEIALLAKAILTDTEAPNGLQPGIRAAYLSYLVNDSIRTGQPMPIKPEEYVIR